MFWYFQSNYSINSQLFPQTDTEWFLTLVCICCFRLYLLSLLLNILWEYCCNCPLLTSDDCLTDTAMPHSLGLRCVVHDRSSQMWTPMSLGLLILHQGPVNCCVFWLPCFSIPCVQDVQHCMWVSETGFWMFGFSISPVSLCNIM